MNALLAVLFALQQAAAVPAAPHHPDLGGDSVPPPPPQSPFTRSIGVAGPFTGEMSASSWNLSIVASIPSVRDKRRQSASASTYSLSVSGPFASDFRKVSWPK